MGTVERSRTAFFTERPRRLEAIARAAREHDALIGAENLLIDLNAIRARPESLFDQAVRTENGAISGNAEIEDLLEELATLPGTYLVGTLIEEIGDGLYASSAPIVENGSVRLRRKLTPLPEVSSYGDAGRLLAGARGERFAHVTTFMDGAGRELQERIRGYHRLAGLSNLNTVAVGERRVLPLICSDAERSVVLYVGEPVDGIAYLAYNGHRSADTIEARLETLWSELDARGLTTNPAGTALYAHGGDQPSAGAIEVRTR